MRRPSRGRRLPPGRSFTALAAVSLMLVACGADTEEAEEPPAPEEPADADAPEAEAAVEEEGDEAAGEDPVLSVVATVAPIADLVEQVGGARVDVTSLVPAGGDAHTYEPRPQDVVILSEADAYFGIGLGLNDGALRLAEENLADDAPLYRLGEVALSDADLVFDHVHDDESHTHGEEEGGHTHGEEEGGHTHGEEEGGHTHGEEEGGHTHGEEAADRADDGNSPGPNPHVWTSVRNAMALLEAIEEGLIELDPDGADQYTANAQAYLEELGDLDLAIQDATATIPGANRTLVTYHDAWSYFARDYDLDYATAVQPADFSEPSASEVRDVIDLIRELDVPVVFGSEVFPTPVLETIAEETGAEYVADLSDDVLPGEPGSPEHTYLELMRRNAHAIVDALGGDASGLT